MPLRICSDSPFLAFQSQSKSEVQVVTAACTYSSKSQTSRGEGEWKTDQTCKGTNSHDAMASYCQQQPETDVGESPIEGNTGYEHAFKRHMGPDPKTDLRRIPRCIG
jgi:hypothetical protein